jgi:hypothetical protein
LACQPNYSGAINQSRTFYCESQSYSDWVTTSDNCTPNPPTCESNIEEKQVACRDGYSGSITEQRSSSCPDPYGQPIFGAWVEIQNSCQMTTNNPMNVNSPVSPISPLNTMDVPATPVVEAPQAVPAEMTVETKETSTQSSRTVSETKEEKQEAPQKVDVPKGKELVNGFGLVMSLEIMNSPIQMQQQQLEIALEYTQELPYELRGSQGFLIEFITESNIADAFNNIANNRWNSLRSHYEVQPDF